MRDAELSACCTAACSMSACAWVVDVKVGVDVLTGLLEQFARAFAARGGFPSDGGTK
jgi:hypothetical protein